MKNVINVEALREFLKSESNHEFEKYVVQEGVKQILMVYEQEPNFHMKQYLRELGITNSEDNEETKKSSI